MFLIAAFAVAGTTACGVRKAPRPPARRAPQIAEVSAIQRGTAVHLSIALPTAARSSDKGPSPVRADIYRLVRAQGRGGGLTDSEFATKSSLVGYIDLASDTSRNGDVLTYRDTDVDFVRQRVSIAYAVRLVTSDGQRLPFSSVAVVVPETAIAGAPKALEPTVSQNHILVIWNLPASDLAGGQASGILGYNIYREDVANAKSLLNKTPVPGTEYQDSDFRFGTEYRYTIRTVTLIAGDRQVESDDSNVMAVKPVDTFAPAPPSAITVAASPRTISLFFASNLEKDVAGYRIYRSDNPDTPLAEWTERTTMILKKTTFVDDSVEAGKTYYYFVVAVDDAGNQSQPSSVASETVPNP